MTILRQAFQGVGPMLAGFEVPVGSTYRLVSVSLALDAAATTSENLELGIDFIEGANYGVYLYRLDLAATATIDLFWAPDGELYLFGGDRFGARWTNSNGRTWGILFTVEVA